MKATSAADLAPELPHAEAPGNGPAEWTVLCVDDEPAILSALRRVLRPEGCLVLQAQGGAEGLALLQRHLVDVVVSDMRMPGMDGAQFLAEVARRWPGTARVLLTGHADTSAAIAAINHGEIYRYISKPWEEQELRTTLRQAAQRVRLEAERDRLQALTLRQNEALNALNAELESRVAQRTAELSTANEQLRRNYLSSIRLFSHFLEMRSSTLAGHGKRVAEQARRMARELQWPQDEVNDVFVAGLLHDIGYVAIPEAITNKPVGKLTPPEMAIYQRHPVLGAQAMLGLEDAQGVAALVRSHHERHDGTGFPDGLAAGAIPRGARLLALASTHDDLLHGHVGSGALTPEQARTVMQRGRGTQFDPELLDAFLQLQLQLQAQPPSRPALQIDVRQLQPGMKLARDLISREGILLLAAGHELTEEMVKRMRQLAHRDALDLTLSVQAPDTPG